MGYAHIPVMLTEVLQLLDPKPGNIFFDGTVGGSGHAAALCSAIEPGGIFVGMDQDRDAIDNALCTLNHFNATVHLFHGNFVQMSDLLSRLNIPAVDGMLLDLGISFHHIASSGRGFSFSREEPLDMRMDIRSDITAEHLVNDLDESELRRLFKRYGEEPRAGQIARRITMERKKEAIRFSSQLADIVSRCVPQALRKPGLHPATRVFMALRIAVNRELERLEQFLDTAVDFLKPGGRICILAFHSLEDRIVKHRLRMLENPCTCPPDLPVCACGRKAQLQVLTKKARRPSAEEIAVNPMARSTRLRAAVKVCP
ncbi:MAG: 16S rRNA (cytosine(1402)-N(4))-methyltransferase RsmH [Deltaproteobacteria bacterium]|nr:16S rRNA (cytosine(1402)-N(4))-methyltransferase RsmH [Deltaproteobacteria bacterium]